MNMNNSNQIFYKARKTILEMFRDRGYEGPYDKASAVPASDFYKYNLTKYAESASEPNYLDDQGKTLMIDLWGFVETRTIVDPDDPNKLLDIKVPVYVHFTSKNKPKKGGKTGLKRSELFANLMKKNDKGEHNEIWTDITKVISKQPAKLNPGDDSKRIRSILDGEVLAGVHVIIVYDGWTYSQNKTPKDMFFTYSNREDIYPIYDLEIWPAHTLVFNYTKHSLVPRHRLLTNAEKRNWLEKQAKFYFNSQEQQKHKAITGDLLKYRYLENYVFQLTPKISLHDPINLYYHGRLRQVYEIVRDGYSPTYRMVKKSPLLQDQGK